MTSRSLARMRRAAMETCQRCLRLNNVAQSALAGSSFLISAAGKRNSAANLWAWFSTGLAAVPVTEATTDGADLMALLYQHAAADRDAAMAAALSSFAGAAVVPLRAMRV